MTPAELKSDPLMSFMRDTLLGDDYTDRENLHALRLQRIDTIFQSMKDQDIIAESFEIDKPLARHALMAYLDTLYSPHYASFAQTLPGRHGRDYTDANFAALTDFMIKRGFTPEASARFSAPADQEDIVAVQESNREGDSFAISIWGKYGSPPSPELVAQQNKPRHQYLGQSKRSRFAESRANLWSDSE